MNVQDKALLVLAAGSSQRFQERSFSSKLLFSWKGKPLLLHTLEALSVLKAKQRLVICPPLAKEEFEGLLHKAGFSDYGVVEGGKRRQDSVRKGLLHLTSCQRVYIHDGARPCVSEELIQRLEGLSEQHHALIPVVPLTSSIKRVHDNGLVRDTLERSKLFEAQTPQVFEFESLRQLHCELADSEQEFNDDSAILEAYGREVMTCTGWRRNLKVTYPEDIERLSDGS